MATRQIKDAKDLSTNELIYFKGHAKATYMSNGKTVEDAINAIGSGGSGSSSGSGAYGLVEHGTSDTTFSLTPNTFHVWDEVSSLTLTLGSETSGVANEYLFQFTSGTEPTVLTLPNDIIWANDEIPAIESGYTYQVSILKGFATLMKFENKSSSSLITFTVEDCGTIEEYQAEKGMTWAEWVNSDYNTGEYIDNYENIRKTGGGLGSYMAVYDTINNAFVFPSDKIMSIEYLMEWYY